MEEDETDDEDLPDPTSNKFFVQEIRVHGLPAGKGIPTQVLLPARSHVPTAYVHASVSFWWSCQTAHLCSF